MESTEGGFGVEIGKGLNIGKFLPFTSAFAEFVEIPENVRVEHAIKWPF
jgi:hypothetical protein